VALEGNFKDFGLADIFQLVGLQKKTGVLTVRGGGGKVVTVTLEKGAVVFADEFQRTEAERLGSVLQRTRRIPAEALAKAMEIQKSTSQRLGHILVEQKIISAAELRQALQLQVKETVYRLFRLQEGSYHFSQEPVTFDRQLYAPIPAEFILMEGVRMIDEWPVIETKIPNFEVVFERVPGASAPVAAKSTGRTSDIEDLMALVEDESEPAAGGSFERGGEALGPKESALLQLVDGRRTVQEVIDLGQLGEFETCKMLYGFRSLNLIRRKDVQPAPAGPVRAAKKPQQRSWGEYGVVGGAVAVLLVVFLFNPWGMVFQRFRSRQGVQEAAALGDLVALSRVRLALEVYYLEKQSYPPELEKLVETGLLRSRELRAHDGRRFTYRGGAKDFQLGAE
jgi:hypothetical protein